MRRKNETPRTKLISLRLPMACYEIAERAGVPLSKLIEYGLQKMLLQYPYLREGIIERLQRHGNGSDLLTNGERKSTKYRIHIEHYRFLKAQGLNISAACECAVLDML